MTRTLKLRQNVYAGLFVACWTAACIYVRPPEVITGRLRGWNLGAGHRHCQPRQNIVFLKTHKTAGSTVMNILLRYGGAYNLTFVLPKNPRTHRIAGPFHRNIIDLRLYNLTNNILTHHTGFNYAEISEVMPKDSVYITIIRKVENRFESAYSYYSVEEHLHKNITDFLRDKNITKVGAVGKYKENPQNEMATDLGLREEDCFNVTAVKDFIYFLERTFHLVMIAERLDESLILMKHLLCWTTDDVVAFRMNARMRKHRAPVTAEMKSKIRKLNNADAQLYEYFASELEKAVSQFGRTRMQLEVQELKTLRKKYYKRCVGGVFSAKKIDQSEFSDKVLGFKVKENTRKCRYLTLSELQFHRLVRHRQDKLIARLSGQTPRLTSTWRVQREQRRKDDALVPENSWA